MYFYLIFNYYAIKKISAIFTISDKKNKIEENHVYCKIINYVGLD